MYDREAMTVTARTAPTAACVFPRCVEGEKPAHCGHDCDKREAPFAHEYGAKGARMKSAAAATTSLLRGVLEDLERHIALREAFRKLMEVKR
jgi:hypothetical protein